MNMVFVYITAGSLEEARRIGCTIVEEKLAACVNIIDRMRSIYRWEGKIEEDQEVILIAKTRESHVRPLTHRVQSLHSYDCPCIVALPVRGGNQDFLDWITAETE